MTMVPVQVTFRNMAHSEAVEARIRAEVAKLEKLYDRIMGCRVVAEIPGKHQRQGNIYNIRIDLTVPGGELVVKHEPSLHGAARQTQSECGRKSQEVDGEYKDIYVAIRDAFKSMRRQLQDRARRRRGDTKTHEATPRAYVSKLFQDEGYGFLETPAGAEIYFHRNSVLDSAFDRIRIGAEVSFTEERGEKGAQASTVKLVG